MSDATKLAISETKTGYKHTEETKDKISETLKEYFRKKKPLSEELILMYGDVAGDWIEAHKEELDADKSLKTVRALRNMNIYEIPIGEYVDFLSTDEFNPEEMVLLKEKLERGEIII